MNKDVILVPSNQLADGIRVRQLQASLPVVSLDSTYTTDADLQIGISRAITPTMNDALYSARAGFDSISNQLDRIAELGSEVQIMDDVVFSGEMMLWLSEQLAARSVKIGRVVCGIAIGEGITTLSNAGIDIDPVLTFDEVDDELCERDLFLSPGSGRRVPAVGANALYFDTKYGRPEQWASIPPDNAESFYRNCLERSLTILRPSIPLSAMGQFIGYRGDLTVEEAIKVRLSEGE